MLKASYLKLPTEKSQKQNILCTLFLKNIGDEFHVLFNYKNDVISDFRNKFIPSYYCKIPNIQKSGIFVQTAIFNY